jgi:hypothetical protein
MVMQMEKYRYAVELSTTLLAFIQILHPMHWHLWLALLGLFFVCIEIQFILCIYSNTQRTQIACATARRAIEINPLLYSTMQLLCEEGLLKSNLIIAHFTAENDVDLQNVYEYVKFASTQSTSDENQRTMSPQNHFTRSVRSIQSTPAVANIMSNDLLTPCVVNLL